MDDFPLSPIEIKVFKIIKAFYKQKKFMPSRSEVMSKAKMKSNSQIQNCIYSLAKKGYLEIIPSASRAIRIRKDI